MEKSLSSTDGVFAFKPSSLFIDNRGTLAKFILDFSEKTFDFSLIFSSNLSKGTVRGLHRQTNPFPEEKIIACTKGRSFHTFVDGRDNSVSFGQKQQLILDATDKVLVYIPPLFFHGYQGLEDNTEILYLIKGKYNSEFSQTVNPLDPKLSIDWPLPIAEISGKDSSSPNLSFYFKR